MNAPDLVIFIPLKPIDRSKQRLAPILPPHRRRALTKHLFTHVVRTARRARVPGDVWVITGDPRVVQWARQEGVNVLVESGAWRVNVADFEQTLPAGHNVRWDIPLNRSLSDALAWADTRGYQAALILPADLPRLSAQDIEHMWRLSRALPPPVVIIAADHRGEGTNALLLRPPHIIPLAFGQGSFTRHVIQAYQANASVYLYTSPGVLHDLDTPEDWQHHITNLPPQERELLGEGRSP